MAPAKNHAAKGSFKVPVDISPATPMQRSPITRRKMGVTAHQKQALIDNLQLEITERARRLRAQYNLQAQGLRSRIEIRINRIPNSLRKMKMEDLLAKCAEQQTRQISSKPPPVPAKDVPPRTTSLKPAQAGSRVKPTGRSQKRMSTQIADDKENENEHREHPKKRARGPQADGAPVRPTEVLSPTSSNSRLQTRDRPASPTKSQLARPGSPLKTHGTGFSTSAATNVFSSLVEKSKAARAAGTKKAISTAKAASTAKGTTASAQGRRGAAPAAGKAPASRPATRTGRRVSANSETSEGSTGTVVRKAGKSAAPAAAKKPTKSTAAKGAAAGTARKNTAKNASATSTTTGTGRVLRKRG